MKNLTTSFTVLALITIFSLSHDVNAQDQRNVVPTRNTEEILNYVRSDCGSKNVVLKSTSRERYAKLSEEAKLIVEAMSKERAKTEMSYDEYVRCVSAKGYSTKIANGKVIVYDSNSGKDKK